MTYLKAMTPLLDIQKFNPQNSTVTNPVHLKIINNEKGKSLFLNSIDSIQSVAVLEFLPDGEIRGNHYHLTKKEHLYIIEGKLRLYYWLPNQPIIEEMIIESGHFITIKPNLGHAYEALEKTLAFEMSSQPYDPEDTIYEYKIKE